jgi:hypothetical protein
MECNKAINAWPKTLLYTNEKPEQIDGQNIADMI